MVISTYFIHHWKRLDSKFNLVAYFFSVENSTRYAHISVGKYFCIFKFKKRGLQNMSELLIEGGEKKVSLAKHSHIY